MVEVGQVVRAQGWPGTKGARFLVKGFETKATGYTAHLLEFDAGTPFKSRFIPVQHLVVDEKATRAWARRSE